MEGMKGFTVRRAARSDRRRAQGLRRAVAELAPETRRAMLAAIESDELIVGAYCDYRGRPCPMLAAHRRGARTAVGDFPYAWDAFADARRPRPATQRELEILKALLQEAGDEAAGGGGPAVAPAPDVVAAGASGTALSR
jgi:hypothetical protein